MKVVQILLFVASLCCLIAAAKGWDCALTSVKVFYPPAVITSGIVVPDDNDQYCAETGEPVGYYSLGSGGCGSDDSPIDISLDGCAPDGLFVLRAFGSSSHLTITVQSSEYDVYSVSRYSSGYTICPNGDYYAPIAVNGNGTVARTTRINVLVSSDTGSCNAQTYHLRITNEACDDSSNYCIPQSIEVTSSHDLDDTIITVDNDQLLETPVVNVLPNAINDNTIVLKLDAIDHSYTYFTISHSTQDSTTHQWSTPVVLTTVNGTVANNGVTVAWDSTHVNKYIVNVSSTAVSSSGGNRACSLTNLTILLVNPTQGSGQGDPQFVGLRGQSFQIHGYDGAVFNIITNRHFQLNALFVFLTGPRPCPIMPSDGEKSVACWSHDGSYLGDLGLKTNVGDEFYVKPGSAATGFDRVEFNNRSIEVGESVIFEYKHTGILVLPSASASSEMNQGKIQRISSHELLIEMSSFTMEIENVDGFVNVRRLSVVPESRSMSVMHSLGSHGLLGQTWQLKRYSGKVKEIEGDVNDYVVVDGLFGNQFVFNQLSSA